jgi:hypothetical protein
MRAGLLTHQKPPRICGDLLNGVLHAVQPHRKRESHFVIAVWSVKRGIMHRMKYWKTAVSILAAVLTTLPFESSSSVSSLKYQTFPSTSYAK